MPEDPQPWRERALAVGCAPLVDAMGRLHRHRAHLPALRSPAPGRVLLGPAVTLQYLPTRDDLPDPDTGFAEVFSAAVRDAPSGAVLVLGSGGYPEVSHAGGVKLTRVATHGLAGVLADGLLRDFAELADLGFATWCRGEAVRWGGDSVMPYAAGVAVEVFGTTVLPGDWVYVDRTGGVVVPSASMEAVLAEAESVVADDARTQAELRAQGSG
ncbi:RraA family protein [Ornithinimicrobium pekingense]|uniref:Putative 4-hydroxy-4-methyl-2-oxoglutarate aldolase n=1 Tax=Ornithinimicrobium pekingense TaxID=384677 RepID=A0ABQ2FEE0_9MICO|nr:RraA family protein [Ornithinimicrobium pekingense]GGK81095.1 dimethylmenaquinone methyltransferase [Ornithinimicrobium pekingense]